MPRAEIGQLPPLTAWELESLRLTGFPSPTAEIQDSTWWKELVGKPPDNYTAKPAKGEYQQEGPFENGILRLNVQPFRIDWYLHPTAAQEKDEGPEGKDRALATIGPFPVILDSFLKLMLCWLSSPTCPEMQRMAFGAILLQPVESHEDGYRRFSQYLHDIKIDPTSRDFRYRINRQRSSSAGIRNLTINRLSNWSVLRSVGYEIQIGVRVGQKQVGRELFACRLDLDINSAAEFPKIPKEQAGDLFQELVVMGREIAEKGDIP